MVCHQVQDRNASNPPASEGSQEHPFQAGVAPLWPDVVTVLAVMTGVVKPLGEVIVA